jgi:hypothetical protein
MTTVGMRIAKPLTAFPRSAQMLMFLNAPITILAVTIAIKDTRLPTGVVVALTVVCFALVGVALRAEFRRDRK